MTNYQEQWLNEKSIQAVIDDCAPPLEESARIRISAAIWAEAERDSSEPLAAEDPVSVTAAPKRMRSWRRIALLIAALLILTLGTALAVYFHSTFESFYRPEDVEIIKRDGKIISLSQQQGDIIVKVEEIIAGIDGKFMLTISMTNDGAEAWPENWWVLWPIVEVTGAEEDIWQEVYLEDRTVSEDGRNISFMYEGYVEAGLADQQLRVSMEGVTVDELVHKSVNMPLLELFAEDYPLVTYTKEMTAEDAGWRSTEVETGALYFQSVARMEPLVIHEDSPHNVVTAAGFLEEGVIEFFGEEFPAGFFIIHEWDDCEGAICDVYLNIQGPGANFMPGYSAALNPSGDNWGNMRFYQGITEKTLPFWYIKEFSYSERKTVAEGTWLMEFEFADCNLRGASQPVAEVAVYAVEDEIFAYKGDVMISPLGITIRGMIQEEEVEYGWFYGSDFDVRLWGLDGEEIPLYLGPTEVGIRDEKHFRVEYLVEHPYNGRRIIDLDQLSHLTIGDTRVELAEGNK